MAFKDISRVIYEGKVKLDYKDKAHRYYVRQRIDWDLPETDAKAWGKIMHPKGTTTLLECLEKKGLMQWPKQVALKELFGFYGGFTNEQGKTVEAGFSKGVGTLWTTDDGKSNLEAFLPEDLLPWIVSANNGWKRKQKKGADIGSVVHDAIEHYIKGEDYDIAENYNWTIKESEYETEADKDRAFEEAPAEVEEAKTAFLQFQKWWLTTEPILHSAENILYSLEYNIAGTYDADISIPTERHPLPEKFATKSLLRITADWKTSKASTSKDAAAPEGVYYTYFIQAAIYEMMRRENGQPAADDLLIVSARKDGGFSLVYASECGLIVERCIEWAKAVILCYGMAEETKKALLAHGSNEQDQLSTEREAF